MPHPSTTSPAAPVLKLTTSDDVLAAVPYLLGFHPRHSLVVIGLSGPRSRVGVTMRIDLDGMPPGELARRAVSALRQDGNDQAVVLVYDAEQVPQAGESRGRVRGWFPASSSSRPCGRRSAGPGSPCAMPCGSRTGGGGPICAPTRPAARPMALRSVPRRNPAVRLWWRPPRCRPA